MPDKDVSVASSYLKGALLLLQNCCATLIANTLGLLNDIMCSADNADFTGSMQSIYYDHKRQPGQKVDFTAYLHVAESKYCTLYRRGKWGKVETTTVETGLYTPQDDSADDDNKERSEIGKGRGRGRGRGRYSGR